MKIVIAALLIAFCSVATVHADVTNVSCTDSIKSLNKTATSEFVVGCPANCTSGSVWGTNTYTTDSAICVAAVHAGAIKATGGEVKVKLAAGKDSYAGSAKNGVTTQGWGHYDQSFLVSPNAAAAGAATNVSCNDSIKSLNKTATMEFAVTCPVNCTSGSVWGTDVYTTDSAICVAAVHAGVIKTDGGQVKVKLDAGKPSYSGAARNGVTSQSWGQYDQSFTVSK